MLDKLFSDKNLEKLSILLILISCVSFFGGYYFNENSAGAGGLNGDFKNTWRNISTFSKNNFFDAINLTATSNSDIYQSSRTPLFYIINKYLNPFTSSQESYISSIFIFSLLIPLIFYYSLLVKYKNANRVALLLICSILLLSPYFRTSAYWGLEENIGILFLILSSVFLNKFYLNNNKKKLYNYSLIFLTTLCSSATFYFDQKLLIIPLICFLQIILKNTELRYKLATIIFFSFFTIPYLYLIFLWGSIIPTHDAIARNVGQTLHLNHIGYTATILSFYFLPLFFLKKNNLNQLLNIFSKNKLNFYLIGIFILYIIYLLIFHEFEKEHFLGKGIVHKFSTMFIEDILVRKIFVYSSFFLSWILILVFYENNKNIFLYVLYFLIITVFIYPIMQEYFDPIIFLLFFLFLKIDINFSFKAVVPTYLYFLLFLVVANLHYYKLIN